MSTVSLLQSHPRFTPKQVTQEIIQRPPVPQRSKADCPPEMLWFVDHVLEVMARNKGVVGQVASTVTRVEVVESVDSRGGLALQSDRTALSRGPEACVLSVAIAQLSTMQRYMHQCRPADAIRTAQFGFEEAIKDNLMRAAILADDDEAQDNFDSLAGSHMVGLVERMQPSPKELKNLLQLVTPETAQ